MTAPDPKFHYWVDPGERSAPKAPITIVASDQERVALARWLDIPALHSLKATLTVRRQGSETATVSGRFTAQPELICGISLDPFVEPIAGAIEAKFRRPMGVESQRSSGDISLNAEEDEPGEWGQAGIDLGALVAEELSLALPDFPRKPEASLDFKAEHPETEAPFAALRQLKEKNE